MQHATQPGDRCGGGQTLISVDDALSRLLDSVTPVTEVETIATARALGRVLAVDQRSTIDVPGHDNSAMDGYVLHSADTAGGNVTLPVCQRIPAGKTGEPLEPGCAARIFTGAPVPPGADAVVMQEDCTLVGDQVTISRTVAAGENIRPRGDDIASGAKVLAAGRRLQPQAMALAASIGLDVLPVCRRLRVAIFSTGDELVDPGQALGEGQIYNSNRYALLGLLERLGCSIEDLGIVPDDPVATREVLQQAADAADLIITSGGVSVGEEDHVKTSVEAMGRLDLWRVAIKPGKPLAFGHIDEKPFIGLPGNPVSAFVTFCIFVRPFILKLQGVNEVHPQSISVPAGFERLHPGKRREYLRARLVSSDTGAPHAELFGHQGSGVLTSVTWATGLVVVPEGTRVTQGDPVQFLPYSELLS